MSEPTDELVDGAGPGLARRLFIAALLVVATALVCWLVLPYAGVYVPWWVPVVGFVVIVAAAVARVSERHADLDEESPEVAGRIGRE